MVSLRLLGDAGACRYRSTNRPDQRIHVTSRMDVRDGERAFVMRALAHTCNFSVIQPPPVALATRVDVLYSTGCMCADAVHMYWPG